MIQLRLKHFVFPLTLVLFSIGFVSLALAPTEAQARIDYEQVREKIKEPCYPLCNLRKSEISKKYYPQENPFYYAQINQPEYNPYYNPWQQQNNNSPNYNAYYNTNNPPVNNNAYYTNNPPKNNNAQYTNSKNNPVNTQNPYGNNNNAYNQNNPTSNQGNQTKYNNSQQARNNANNNSRYYANANTTAQNPQNNNARYYQNSDKLSNSGAETYVVISLVILLTFGIVYYIRRKRKMMFGASFA